METGMLPLNDEKLRSSAPVTRAALATATMIALACACGGAVEGQAQPDGGNADTGGATPDSGAPDASVADAGADADAYAADVEAPDVSPGDGDDVADQGADSPCPLPSVPPELMAPVFFPPSGSTQILGLTWTVSCPLIPPGVPATIYYTTDNTMPTHRSMVFTGPVMFSMVGSVTIFAICTSECFDDSPSATASYTVTLPETGPGDSPVPPVISPIPGAMNNDFTVTMTATYPPVAANICYTTDGVTTPTCDATTGACTGTSKQYDPSTGAPMNAAIAEGRRYVVVQAIACAPGFIPSGVSVPAQYDFVVADPTMTNPAPGAYTLPADGGGLEPTIGTITRDSSNATVSIALATAPSVALCGTGTAVPNGTVFSGQPGEPSPLTSTTTFAAMACKPGYQPSNRVSFSYTIH
jgi:hypothetical protein